jgi:pyruvate/2-oxoglutarate dehydrogenase complex dihydrolipoamide dehydrogenase (E3) component
VGIKQKVDVLMIGAGPGGYVAAIREHSPMARGSEKRKEEV